MEFGGARQEVRGGLSLLRESKISYTVMKTRHAGRKVRRVRPARQDHRARQDYRVGRAEHREEKESPALMVRTSPSLSLAGLQLAEVAQRQTQPQTVPARQVSPDPPGHQGQQGRKDRRALMAQPEQTGIRGADQQTSKGVR